MLHARTHAQRKFDIRSVSVNCSAVCSLFAVLLPYACSELERSAVGDRVREGNWPRHAISGLEDHPGTLERAQARLASLGQACSSSSAFRGSSRHAHARSCRGGASWQDSATRAGVKAPSCLSARVTSTVVASATGHSPTSDSADLFAIAAAGSGLAHGAPRSP